MATAKLELYLLFVSISSLFFPALSSITTSATDVWCDETPNPGPCKYYMNQFPKNYLPKQKSDFKKWSLQIALDRAFHAAVHTNGLGPKCRNEKEKAAWADCMVLYENTILQLNQTLDPSTKCTDFDVQTWLSAALTNLETCRDGFVELGVTDFILPLMSNNVSKLISNALAINNASTEPTTYYSDGPQLIRKKDQYDTHSLQMPEETQEQDESHPFLGTLV
ncbi:Pectinesterase inhibitor domain [Dillenia turbinata]|uniref:Pectinesterase inhibitor domain n=1 Tax=Dillenia turbinata TaxID=194707 RepID=A0AAN8VA87_9MAGN